jgi:hypothetical protein
MALSRHSEHQGQQVGCWHCLSKIEQSASREIWYRLAADPRLGLGSNPKFRLDLRYAEREVSAGLCIELRRPEQEGRRIIMPYSLFWSVVEVIHDERRQLRH